MKAKLKLSHTWQYSWGKELTYKTIGNGMLKFIHCASGRFAVEGFRAIRFYNDKNTAKAVLNRAFNLYKLGV